MQTLMQTVAGFKWNKLQSYFTMSKIVIEI